MLKKCIKGMLNLIVGVMLLLAVVGCDFEEKAEDFTIKNDTADYISSVYYRSPGTLIWTNSYYSISIGSSITLSIPNNQDLQLRTSNGNLYTKLSQSYGTITFTSSDLDSSSPRTVSVGNSTGEYISSVYIREAETLIWTNTYYSISNGSAASITIPRDRMDSQYKTDIQLRTSNGDTYTKTAQTITHNGSIIFTSSDFDSASSRTVSIGNNTGDYISSVYIREPGTLVWTNTYYSISNGSAASITIPRDKMDSSYRTDIQLRTSNGNLYTKLSQTITHNGNVIFTSSDFDSSSPRTVSIGNSTGEYVSSVYIREPGTSTWTNTYYSISNGSAASITIPRDKMDSMYRTDIQLRSSGNNYTKTYQTVTHNGSIIFTSSDLGG